MSRDTTQLEVDAPVEVSTPAGERVPVHVERLRRSVATAARVTGTFTVSTDAWRRLVDAGALHLSAVAGLPTFDTEESVRVDAILDPGVAGDLPASGVEIARRLENGEGPLCRSRSWYVTRVQQTTPAESGSTDGETTYATTTRWREVFTPAPGTTTSGAVRSLLDRSGRSYDVLDDGLYRFAVTAPSGREWPAFASADDGAGTCTLYAVCPDRVPAEDRPAVATQLAAATDELARGGFGLDPDDGEVRFRVVVRPTVDSLEETLGLVADAVAAVDDVPEDQSDT